jgi:hypothetical protein
MNSISRLVVLFSIMTPLYTHTDFLDDYENKDPHFLEMLDETNDTTIDIINNFIPSLQTLRALDPCLILDLLTDLGAIALLQQDFFLSTNRPARRSLLDMPLFQPNTAVYPCPSFLNTQLFLNFTPNARFTRTSSNINSYIATTEPTLLGKIEELIDAIKPLSNGTIANINVNNILELISNMTLVERNIGFMFQTGGRWERLQLRIMSPFYYHERNFFLSNNDLDELAQELGYFNENTFDDSYAIADRLGLGDTRIEFGIHAIENRCCNAVLSLYATIPTAFSIAKGLAGSTFKAPSTYPRVDFNVLYDAAQAAIDGNITPEQKIASFNVIQGLLLSAWERAGAALLDNGLGNESHLGLGGCAAIDAPLDQWVSKPWASCVYWHNRIMLEYLFKNDTTRFYINKNDPSSFDRDFDNLELCEQNLEFLQNEIINRICLLGIATDVTPGIIGEWKTALIYQDIKWNGYCGFDFWFQTKESHGCIYASQELVSTLSLEKSFMPWAFQNKIIAGFGYTHTSEHCTLTFGLDGDATLFTTGIGRDYTVTLRLDAQF